MQFIRIAFLGLVLFYSNIIVSQSNNQAHSSTVTLHSKILDEERTLFINFPESYFNENYESVNYPIIILLDGQTFLKTTNGIVHFMSSSRNRNNLMLESIIVAIENVDRERDFTVTKIKTKRENTSGGGNNFLDFIEQELIPYIDKNYRTQEHRALIGHSLGGLLALNAYMSEKTVFDTILVIDPSIWWNDEIMHSKVDSMSDACFNRRLYLATANQNKDRYVRNKKRHDNLATLLNKKSKNNASILHETFDNENHRSVPLKAIYNGLKFLNN